MVLIQLFFVRGPCIRRQEKSFRTGGAGVKPVWQRDVWAGQVRSGEMYDEKWEYVRRNPCRHGLVERPEEWPFEGELNVLEWR
jgi:hypothetical protein